MEMEMEKLGRLPLPLLYFLSLLSDLCQTSLWKEVINNQPLMKHLV